MWIWIYLSGVLTVLVIIALICCITYEKEGKLELDLEALLCMVLYLVCSWLGVAAILAIVIGDIIRDWFKDRLDKPIIKFKKKNGSKDQKERDDFD